MSAAGRTCRGPAGRTRNPRGLAERRPSIARSRIKTIHAVVGRDGAAPRLARSCQIISKEDAEQFMDIKNPRVSGLQDEIGGQLLIGYQRKMSNPGIVAEAQKFAKASADAIAQATRTQ
jgi:hypothetical protein